MELMFCLVCSVWGHNLYVNILQFCVSRHLFCVSRICWSACLAPVLHCSPRSRVQRNWNIGEFTFSSTLNSQHPGYFPSHKSTSRSWVRTLPFRLEHSGASSIAVQWRVSKKRRIHEFKEEKKAQNNIRNPHQKQVHIWKRFYSIRDLLEVSDYT